MHISHLTRKAAYGQIRQWTYLNLQAETSDTCSPLNDGDGAGPTLRPSLSFQLFTGHLIMTSRTQSPPAIAACGPVLPTGARNFGIEFPSCPNAVSATYLPATYIVDLNSS